VAAGTPADELFVEIARDPDEPRRAGGLFHGAPVIPLLILVAWIVAALIGPVLTGSAATRIALNESLHPPVGFGGSPDHLLGTDQFGRDMLARLLGGARVALVVAAASVGIAGILGLVFGILAGYLGGLVDSVISRVADVVLALPVVLLALLFAVRFGPSLLNVVVIIVILFWGRFARLARGETMVLRELDFVESARAQGASGLRIMATHVALNVLPSLLVLATLQTGWAILTEASLSFLGAGIPPPAPAWGSMVASGADLVETAWWVPILPGAAILLVTVAVNLVGDWIRDRLDPTLIS
jgi:peptide/nickel transport system permease protein